MGGPAPLGGGRLARPHTTGQMLHQGPQGGGIQLQVVSLGRTGSFTEALHTTA